MSGIDYTNYINNILPAYLNNDAGKAFEKAFTNTSEDLYSNAQSARQEGMILECHDDDLSYHFDNSSLLISPFETFAQQRAYLNARFDTWKKAGSVSFLQSELKRFGYKNTKVITWSDLINSGVKNPFGGGFTKIIGFDPNGGMTYLPKRPDVTVQVQQLAGVANQPLLINVFSITPGVITVSIQLQTDAGGFPVSTGKQVFRALQKAGVDDYLGYGYLGTGNGFTTSSGLLTLPFGYHSFFFLDIDAPNGFGDPILWDDNTVSYYTYTTGRSFVRWHDFSTPNGALNFSGVWATSENNIWITDSSGLVYRYNGSSWMSIPTGSPFGFRGILGFSNNNIWIIGGSNQALNWNGSSFISTTLPIGTAYNSIAGNAFNDFWIVGNGGKILHYDDTSFTSQLSGTAQILNSVWAFAGNDVWAVGNNATVLHYDGTSWSPVALPMGVTDSQYAVWGAASNDVWIGGLNNGYLLHWDGTSISKVTVPTNGATILFQRIMGTSASNVFAFSLAGGFFVYDGTAWYSATSILSTSVKAAFVLPMTTDVIGVGINGTSSNINRYSLQQTGEWSSIYNYGTLPDGVDTFGIFGSSDTDIWLHLSSTALHFNGTSTTSYPLPYATQDCYFSQSTSTTDAWVVVKKTMTGLPVILHWDGTSWTESFASPAPKLSFWANGPTDAWAGKTAGVLYRWDGTMWNLIPAFTAKNITALFGFAPNQMYIAAKDDLYFYNGATFTLIYTFSSFGANEVINVLGGKANTVFAGGEETMLTIGVSYSNVSGNFLPLKPNPSVDHFFNISPLHVNAVNSVWGFSGFSSAGLIVHYNGTDWETVNPSMSLIPQPFCFFSFSDTSVYAFGPDALNHYRLIKFAPLPILLPSGATGHLWDGGDSWDGLLPYAKALTDLKTIVRKFKPVSTSCRFARIAINGKGIVYSIGENYEEDAYGNLSGPYLSSYLVR